MTRTRLALTALLWVVTTVCVHAQSAEQAKFTEIDGLMGRYTGDVPGASLLVTRDGKAIVRRGYGYADLEARVQAGPETNYRLASMTKQFTAACILLLKQDGKLRLEDRVRKWLPELPASDDRITVYQLLTHTSGLIDYEDLIPPGRTSQLNDADVLSMIAVTAAVLLRARQRLPLQQWRLCTAGPDRAAHFGHGSGGFHEDAHIPATRHGTHAHVRARPRTAGERTAPMATVKSTASGREPTRTPRAPLAATAVSTRPLTTWPSGMRRCIPTSC